MEEFKMFLSVLEVILFSTFIYLIYNFKNSKKEAKKQLDEKKIKIVKGSYEMGAEDIAFKGYENIRKELIYDTIDKIIDSELCEVNFDKKVNGKVKVELCLVLMSNEN